MQSDQKLKKEREKKEREKKRKKEREKKREKKRERKKREREKKEKKERETKYLLTIILTGGSQVTLINPNFSEWKSVGLQLTIPMMYHT